MTMLQRSVFGLHRTNWQRAFHISYDNLHHSLNNNIILHLFIIIILARIIINL